MKNELIIKNLKEIKKDIKMGALTITNKIILKKINKLIKEIQ